MSRRPTGPDAGADDGDPSVAAARRNNGQLTRSMILQSALEIVDRDGVDRLSMRRLSDALGRDPVMLYRHVPNKAAVLDGVAEIVLAQLLVDNTDPNWAGQLPHRRPPLPPVGPGTPQPIAQSDDHVIAVWLPFNPFVELVQRGFCRSAAISAASKVTAVDRWVARTPTGSARRISPNSSAS